MIARVATRRRRLGTRQLGSSNHATLTQECVADFLTTTAKCDVPSGLPGLVRLLAADGKRFQLVNGDLTAVRASNHAMNPFFVPIAKDATKGSYIGYMRWPTQKPEMDLQIVETTEVGLKLLSLNTKSFCFRQLVEYDFNNYLEASGDSARISKEAFAAWQLADYKEGDFLSFFSKLKALSDKSSRDDKRVALDKYLLLRTNSSDGLSSSGGYPDCYERVASDFASKGNTISSLVTCEKAVNVFYSWGHPIAFHARLLQRADGFTNEKEAVHCARASMRMPCWTTASTRLELQHLVSLAGFTSTDKLGEMHWMRSSDPREKDVGEKGVSPQQVVLDQAAHVMDAVALGFAGKSFDAETKALIASKYSEGGYPDIATFILS